MSKNPLQHRWSDRDEQELLELQERRNKLHAKKTGSRDSWVEDFRATLSTSMVGHEVIPYILYDNAEVRLQVRRLFHYRDAVNAKIPLVATLREAAACIADLSPPPVPTIKLLDQAADEIENLRLLLEAKL